MAVGGTGCNDEALLEESPHPSVGDLGETNDATIMLQIELKHSELSSTGLVLSLIHI